MNFKFLLSRPINSFDSVPWWQSAIKRFSMSLLDHNFPCIFAKRAHELKGELFLFIECNSQSLDSSENLINKTDTLNLKNALIEYTEFLNLVPPKARLYRPLIIFFNIKCTSIEHYQSIGWRMLQVIHDLDPAPWPDKYIKNPEKKGWRFIFNGRPIFLNINNPLHIEQKSRNTSDYLTFIINPIETFEIVAPIKNGKRKISEVIRERIKIYNKLDFLPSTLSIGDPNSSDWMQFQHEEGTSKLPTKCPLIISGDIHD